MKYLVTAWNNIKANREIFSGNILLLALIIILFSVLNLFNKQLILQFGNKNIPYNAIVTGKGSEFENDLSATLLLQPARSDFNMNKARDLLPQNAIRNILPLYVDKSYLNHQITATVPQYFDFHRSAIVKGRGWQKKGEVVLGSYAAKKTGLKIGDEFDPYNLSEKGRKLKVVGILGKTNYSLDNAIFLSLETIWEVKKILQNKDLAIEQINITEEDKKLTALLLLLTNKSLFPQLEKLLEEEVTMQLITPNSASNKILKFFAAVKFIFTTIIFLASLLVLRNLSLTLTRFIKNQQYQIAILRLNGATPKDIFFIIMAISFILTLLAIFIGLTLSHIIMALFSIPFIFSSYLIIDPFFTSISNLHLALIVLLSTLLTAVIPAIKAAKTDIGKITTRL